MGCLDLSWTDEERDAYVDGFQLHGKKSFNNSCCGFAAWWRPAGWERRERGAVLFRLLGAGLLIRLLKECSCYPRTIAGTERGSAERERALILAVPLTVKYESGHLVGGAVHLCIAVSVFAAVVLSSGLEEDQLMIQGSVLGGQLVIIWFVHVLPVLCQRLNRGRLFWAIADLREKEGPV
jgi:hypothetical protein